MCQAKNAFLREGREGIEKKKSRDSWHQCTRMVPGLWKLWPFKAESNLHVKGYCRAQRALNPPDLSRHTSVHCESVGLTILEKKA